MKGLKTLFLVQFVLLLSGAGLMAQPQVRSWDKGPLTWADFQGVAPWKVAPKFDSSAIAVETEVQTPEAAKVAGEEIAVEFDSSAIAVPVAGFEGAADEASGCWLEYTFVIRNVNDTVAGLQASRSKLLCVMDTKLSWAEEEARTGLNLRYNQVLFNLAEIQRRSFQPLLDRGDSGMSYDDILGTVLAYSASEEQRFNMASDMGADSTVVNRWLDSTNRLLMEIPAEPKLNIVYTGEGFGVHLAMGTTLLGKGLQQTFKPSFDFEFGFDMATKRHLFMWNFLIGGGGSKRDFVLDGAHFLKGHSYTLFDTYLGWGYEVLNYRRLTLAPFIGGGLTMIGASYSYDDEVTFSDVCLSWFGGLMADWKICCDISNCDHSGERSLDYLSLRLMVYASRSKLAGCNDVSLNLLLAINGGEKFLKFK